MAWSHSAYRLLHADPLHDDLRHAHHTRHRRRDRPPRRAARSGRLRIRSGLTDGTATLTISGELDLLTAPLLSRALAEVLAREPERLVFELSQLGYADCAAARLIAYSAGSLPSGQRPVLRRPSFAIRRMFQLTGLDRLCDIDPDDEAAPGASGPAPGAPRP